MEEYTLKNCPFCGGKATLIDEPNQLCVVKCFKCNSDGKTAFEKETAIKAWNTRHEPTHELTCKNCGEKVVPQYPLTPEEWHDCSDCSGDVLDINEVTLSFLQKYCRMPKATFEEICREIDVKFNQPTNGLVPLPSVDELLLLSREYGDRKDFIKFMVSKFGQSNFVLLDEFELLKTLRDCWKNTFPHSECKFELNEMHTFYPSKIVKYIMSKFGQKPLPLRKEIEQTIKNVFSIDSMPSPMALADAICKLLEGK